MKPKITRTEIVKYVLMGVTIERKGYQCKVSDDGSVRVWNESYDAWLLPHSS